MIAGLATLSAFAGAGIIPEASATCGVNSASGDCSSLYGVCVINSGTCGPGCVSVSNSGHCNHICVVNSGKCANLRSSSCWISQPVHTYGSSMALGTNSNTLSEQTSGAPTGSVEGGGAGFVTVQDSNVADCNGDGIPGDYDGDYDIGTGGGFFGSSSEWDTADNCGYDLSVHASTGTATDISSLPVGGVFGVDDVAGPVVVTDPNSGATVSCQVDGSITPGTDANDCLNVWVNTWSPGSDPVCAIGHGGDDGYWLILQSGVSENGGSVTAATATTGTLAADS